MEKQHLILSLADGDKKAFDEFFHIYYKQVFRYSYYLLKDITSSREVASNTFLSVWTYRSSLTKIQSIEAYLYTVTRNECKKFLADRNSYNTISLDEIPIQIEMTGHENPEEHLIQGELETTLSEIISTLPEKCRVIFLLSRNEGLKNAEIAERLSISESTVRVQIKLALEKLTIRIKEIFPHLTLSLLLLIFFG